MFGSMREWLTRRLKAGRITTTTLRGLAVIVDNSRPDVDTADALARLDEALALLERHAAHHVRRMRRDFARLLVARYPCRGAYFPDDRTCLVELTFVVNRSFTPSQVAATILHEAMHARLHAMGFPLDMEDRARQERFCRRAEIEFGLAVDDGAPIVERALTTLHSADEDAAPAIDWALAAERVARADLDALAAPAWLKRAAARRRGLDA